MSFLDVAIPMPGPAGASGSWTVLSQTSPDIVEEILEKLDALPDPTVRAIAMTGRNECLETVGIRFGNLLPGQIFGRSKKRHIAAGQLLYRYALERLDVYDDEYRPRPPGDMTLRTINPKSR